MNLGGCHSHARLSLLTDSELTFSRVLITHTRLLSALINTLTKHTCTLSFTVWPCQENTDSLTFLKLSITAWIISDAASFFQVESPGLHVVTVPLFVCVPGDTFNCYIQVNIHPIILTVITHLHCVDFICLQ